MKRATILLIIIIAVISVCSCGSSFSAAKKIESQKKTERIENLVKNKEIYIEVGKVIPMKYPAKNTQDGYFLKISGDTVNCFLPYYGESSTPVYGGDVTSIEVQNKKVKILEDYSNKGQYLFKFNVVSGKDNWEITVQIFDNGKSNIGCSCYSKDYISYMGEVKEDKK